MKGFIIINAYLKSEQYLYQAKRLKQEFEKLNVEIDILKNDFFLYIISENKIVSRIKKYDFCIYIDKDKYILKIISKTGLKVFNSDYSINVCDDKMLTYIELSDNGIDIPKTLPGLLCYDTSEKIKDITINQLESELNYPLIIKESYGSLGKGIYLVKDRQQLLDIMQNIKCKPHLFQKFIKSSYGKDIRVMVIGKRVIGAMLRKSQGDFRSNLSVGGRAEVYKLTDEMKNLALSVANILKLDYCGIDFLLSDNGKPIVCEVNSNAFFYGFEKTTKINVAKIYAEYIISVINQGKYE